MATIVHLHPSVRQPFPPPERTLIGALEDDGVAALLQLYADAYDGLRNSRRGTAAKAVLGHLLDAFIASHDRAWHRIFAALKRVESYASQPFSPSMSRIRAFLIENADLDAERDAS
jgi:hypothetical protein